MKKMLFLLFAVALTSTLYAEDVVTTREGEASYYIPNYGGLSVYQFDEPELVRKGGKVYKDGVRMTKREYKNFLANTCPAAYTQYKKGHKLTDAGWSTFAVGNAIFWLCGISWIESFEAGLSMSVIGGAAMVASVPMICVGYSKRHKSVDTYNQRCSSDYITYNLKADDNGIGLAINF